MARSEMEIELTEKLLEVQEENARLRDRVSNADRNVTKHLETVKELKAALDGNDTDDKPEPAAPDKATNELDRRREDLDRRERVLSLSLERGIDPRQAFDLLGLDGADDAERLDRFAEHDDQIRSKTREGILGANGRTPTKNLFTAELTAAHLDRMPDDMLKNISTSVLSEALQRAEPEQQKRPTLRSRISAALGGTQ